jgi:hypothetical protein
MRRAAAEHGRRRHPSGHGEVGACAGAPLAEPQHRPGRDVHGRAVRHRPIVHSEVEDRPGHRHDQRRRCPERGAEQRHFERGGAIEVADEVVGEPK